MTLTVALLIIFLGLILILLEILVLPGIIVGIFGAGLTLVGIASVYINQGSFAGNIVLLSTAVVSVLMLYFTFKSDTWKKVSLNTSLDGKVNTFGQGKVNAGDKGITISRLAPAGKALINEMQLEVHSVEGFINEGVDIVVVKISDNKIIVKSNHN